MKKLTFISVLVVVINICFTVSTFAEFYMIPVRKKTETATRVPKTGQTGCWDSDGSVETCTGTGQDGDYQLGVSPAVTPRSGETGSYTVYGWSGTRFTDNNDGTVTDNLTGLIWLKNANSLSGSTVWASALSYCNNLEAGGYTDWRLPNINELHSLVDLSGETNPALLDGHPFTNVVCEGYVYWSSTTYEHISHGNAWWVYMGTGHVGIDYKDISYNFVWPVRGGN